MSINQASIHYNLPYSSLYGRFRRGKYEADLSEHEDDTSNVEMQSSSQHSMIQHADMQTEQQQQQQQAAQQQSQQQQSTIQPQIMLLQYQHAPAPHIQMYQPAAPS